ncbi:hypothetical protein BASA81_002533 [Batrachochytrium salamandrivorans]|nr:hypothetical protein BASA81_002533 [Batrachochytrium salamandrivorans]
MLVDGLRSVQDAGVQKVCAQTLLALCKEWLSATPLPAAPLLQQHFYQFTLESVTPASFEATMQPHFDAKDAACSQLLLQICLLHLALCELLGTRWVEYLSTVYLAPKCNQEVVQEYCTALQLCKNSPKELRQKFQKLFLVRGGE